MLPSRQAARTSRSVAFAKLLEVHTGTLSCRLQWYTACSPGVLAAVDAAVESLVKLGAAIVDIHIPELNQVQVRDCDGGSVSFWSCEYNAAVFA